jgi:hypothetical protein
MGPAPATISSIGGGANYSLETVFENVVRVIIPLAAIVCFLFIVYAGFGLITSGGDPKKVGAAQSALTYAIGGMIVVLIAFLILQLISFFTGNTDILFFKLRLV